MQSSDTKPLCHQFVLVCIAEQQRFALRKSLFCKKDCLLSGNTFNLRDSCPIGFITATVSYGSTGRAALQLWVEGFNNGWKHIRIALVTSPLTATLSARVTGTRVMSCDVQCTAEEAFSQCHPEHWALRRLRRSPTKREADSTRPSFVTFSSCSPWFTEA